MKLFTDKDHMKYFVRTVIGILAGALLITFAQHYMTLSDYEISSGDFLNNVCSSLELRSESLKVVSDYNDEVNGDLASNLSYLYSAIAYDEVPEEDKIMRYWDLCELVRKSGVEELYVAYPNGNTVYACYYIKYSEDEEPIFTCDYDENSINLIEKGIFTAEQLKQLDDETLYNFEGHLDVTRDGTAISYKCIVISGEEENDHKLFILGDDTEINESLVAHLGRLDSYFDTIVNYDSIRAFAIDKKTGTIIYTSRNISDYQGTKASDHGIDLGSVSISGKKEKIQLDGKKTTVIMKEFSSPELGSFILVTTPAGIDKEMRMSIIITSLVLAVVVLFIFSIGIGLRGSGRKMMIRKLAAVSVAGILIVGAASFYTRTLNDISQAMQQGIRNAEVFENNLSENADLEDDIENYYENKQISILQAVRTCFERNWDLVFDYCNPDTTYTYFTRDEEGMRVSVNDSYGNPLKSNAGNYIMGNIVSGDGELRVYVINHDGLTISTNTDKWYYGLISGVDFCVEQEFSAELTEVLERRVPYFYSREKIDGENSIRELIGIPVDLYTSSDGEGNTFYHSSIEYEANVKDIKKEYGLLVLADVDSNSFFINEDITSTSTIESMRAAEGATLSVISCNEGHDVIYQTDDFKQRFLSDIGFSEEDYLGDNYKFTKINGTNYFASLVKLDNDDNNSSLLTLLSKHDVFYGRNEVSVAAMISALLILFFMTMHLIRLEPEEETGSHYDKDGVTDIARGIIAFLAVVIVFFAIVVRRTGDDTTAFAYAVSRCWEKGVHIFSLSYVGYLLLVISVIVYTAKRIMKIIAPSLSSQMETVARLFLSVMQYAGIIIIIFYSMYLFGVQTGTVITSAGIMTIVVGLGANSLIGDIVAGLFIIIEREYKVDDIVTIDNYTGVVKEIGLRTTKLLDSNGNLKTLNNSKINGVLNLTDNYSKTFITASFSQDFTVSEVEKFIEQDLKKSLENNRKIIEGPWFSGITDMKGGNYTVSIGVRCRQQDQWSVRKEVYRNLMQLSKEKGVKLS